MAYIYAVPVAVSIRTRKLFADQLPLNAIFRVGMPITATVEHTRGRLYTRAMGLLTYEELRYHLTETRALTARGYPELFDAAGAEAEMSIAQIQSLANMSGEMFNRGELGPTAIVVTGRMLFGMTRMYEKLNTDSMSPVHIFLEVPPAEAWLAKHGVHLQKSG
jgi:hypothetical protein